MSSLSRRSVRAKTGILAGKFLPSVTAAAAGIGTVVILILCTSPSPGKALAAFFTGPFTSVFYFGNMLNTAGLLCFAAAGACIALQGGTFNLGGEGQIYVSGFAAAILLDRFADVPSPAALAAAFAAAAAAGALMGFLPGLLKGMRGINELLTSFLLSGALIPVIDYLISSVFRDKQKNLLATPMIAEKFRLTGLLPPSSFNISFFIALTVTAAAAVFLFKTGRGYILRTSGTAPEFAVNAGFSRAAVSVQSMTVSGAFHGMTGFFAVTGTYFTCHAGFYSGMGWNALAAALIAKKNPQAVFPAALVLSYLTTASDRAVLTSGFSFDSASLIQAAVFLFISAHLFINRAGFFPRLKKRRQNGGGTQ